MIHLLIAECILLGIVLLGYPLIARTRVPPNAAPPRGLNLPQGSVRSMLALAIVGTFVVFVAFGVGATSTENYERVVTILGTLAGPVLGFYFGSRHVESRRGSQGDGPSAEATDVADVLQKPD